MKDVCLTESGAGTVRHYGLYRALRYIPIALFGLYVVLIFVFSVLPVAYFHSVNSGFSDSLIGNAYFELSGVLSTDEHIFNSLAATYVFAGLSVVYIIVSIFVMRSAQFKKRKSGAFIGQSFAGNFYSVMYALYIVFFALGCTIAINVLVDDAGRNVLSVGPFPIVIAAVDALFVALSVVTVAVRHRMESKCGELRRLESESSAAIAS